MNIFKKIANKKSAYRDYGFYASKEERDTLCSSIINSSSPRAGFYLLLILSTFIVAAGLIKNNLVLIIGGMMVAPLLSPILSISLGITIFNYKVFIRSVLVFIISFLVALLVSMFIGLIIKIDINNIEAIKMIHSFDIATILIPIAAGAAASFTWAKKELNSSLSGVAVTVTLLPPLTIMGLSLSVKNYSIFIESLNVYLLNVSGIIVGSLIIFLLMGFYRSSRSLVRQVELESKEVLK